jgi:glycerol uptake facilitator-like aquaporin
MATKKAASTNKKTPAKKSAAVKTTNTTVTTAPVAAAAKGLAEHIQQAIRSVGLWRALGAELVGTFLFVGVVIAGQGQPIFVLFGLAGIALMLGSISGAHVNPAITIGALVTRRIGWLRSVGYIIAQLIGAALAYFVLTGFIGGAESVSAEAQAYGQSAPALYAAIDITKIAGKEWFVFFAELTGAAILGLAYAHAGREAKDGVARAFTVGFGVFIGLMVAISAASYVGASAIVNPAAAIALQAYSWETIWPLAIYALAPAIGAVIGFVTYDLLRGKTTK